ncbi:uncharacterized protein CANTADRAFT_26168 [Suhomyces tanzawaensis NRRL Y-17324]|uniref:Coatomer subunit delta n=1 Tax=Suhomyces tanzawaensis NRRL Y-17324 TaxID=984487 RepID=A0A1E4SI51_9ASCO|nr:uncharacterized protein CANTADRAFT_26168 [Suhomyces tanzawaensis NRRL Y-17324]ODV79127.1 hypothetical protein CANTADRAFT_26168 [Suhomyces tanzawaensis NRRL Y-17324]
MVVLAASICTRGGKALLSRQFKDLSKDRITALLANFPSLINDSSSQHTTIEDEHVRYVYQPLEEFYIVLITNRTSNILQDIDTLHLFASTISNLLRNVDEGEIFDNAFEIISAFDEIITLGYKENVTMSQVQTFLKMDSHEEKIQEIIERNKELEANEERKRRAKEIQRKELARRNMEQFPSGGAGGYDSYQTSQTTQSYQPTYQPTPVIETNTPSPGLGGKPIHGRGGLQLGKKPTKITQEAHQPLLAQSQPVFQHASTPVQQKAPEKTASPAPSVPKVQNNGILITINEKVTAELTREGSIVQSEVKGDLQLRINNAELANSKLLLKTAKSGGIQYKPHPNVDRNLFTSRGIIGLKDKSKSFPANDQAIGVLRWRATGKNDDSSLIPLVITAWVNINDQGIAEVTLEYELTSDYIEAHSGTNHASIENVKLLVPIVSSEVNLNNESNQNISYEVSDFGVIFDIGSISLEDSQGSFEFTIPANDEDSLFPIELQFEINNTEVTESDVSLGKVQVIDVVSNNEDEASLPFDLHSSVTSESFQVN